MSNHGELLEAMKEMSRQQMRIGRLLCKIHETKEWKNHSKSWSHYIAEYIGITESAAGRWMNTARVWDSLKYPKRMELIYSKMRWLSYIVTQQNVIDLLKWAAKKKVPEIRERVYEQGYTMRGPGFGLRGYEDDEDIGDIRMCSVSVQVTRDEKITIEKALVRVIEETGIGSRGEALTLMAKSVLD